MAQALPCDVCQTAASDFLITNMQNGDTFSACGPDLVEWCRAMVTAADDVASEKPDATPDEGAPASLEEGDNGAPPNGTPKSKPEPQPESETEPEPATN